MTDKISYEELEKVYRAASKSSTAPSLVLSNLADMRSVFGDEQVDIWIADGTIQVLNWEDIDSYA